MIWAIILSSLLGILAAPSALGRAAGSDEVSGIMLYAIVALIGAEVSLGALREAPLYILSGFLILALQLPMFCLRMLPMMALLLLQPLQS